MAIDTPLVSVIVPAYNAAATLEECVASVRGQTLSDWELLISDDGSADATPQLATALVARDARIRHVRHPNGGVSAARNRAAQVARGRYLAFLDADDRWAPDKLAWQVAALEADADAGVCFTRARFISEAGAPTGTLSTLIGGEVPVASLLYGNPATTCSSLMASRALFDEVGGFDESLRFAEDLEWMLRATCRSGRKLVALDAALTDYRTSPGGLSAQLERMQDGWEALVDRARGYAPGLLAEHESAARAAHLAYLARRAVRLGHPAGVVRDFLRRSLAADPRIVLREPHRMLFALIASLLPAGLSALRG